MRNTKRSITFKVVIGYVLLAVLAAVSIWFVYTQVITYTNLAKNNNNNNDKLFLVGDITTDLYETENISRRLIQTGYKTDLDLYLNHIDSIRTDIQKLQESYADTLMSSELDSISHLLDRKTNNLNELLRLREQDRNRSYYTQVIDELKKMDESFESDSYEERFADLEPHQRRVLVRLLKYAEEDNANNLTNRTADSLIGSVKNVLSELEIANKEFRNTVNQKENELLDNDMVLNQQLRSLLAKIEQEEREASVIRAETSEKMLKETSIIMIIAGSVSILILLIFPILIIKDITRSHRYRLELEEAKTFAESLLKSREQFMAAITHDLRSPLNTLIGYTDLIHKTALNTKQSHYLQHVKKSSDFILRLVNDLLDLSKLEAGKMLVEKLPFNPKTLVEETVYNSLPGKIDKAVAIKVESTKDSDCQVLSDPFRIKQIISNLVTNAYKFTHEGEIRISTHLKKEIEDSYCLIISVKDSGIGIPKEKQQEIFEEFSQENSNIEKKYGGTGLGLTITKSLTELLKGELELLSTTGKGSEFIVSLPVIKLQEKETGSEKFKPEQPEFNSKLLQDKIALVVDDEPSQLALTQELVKSIGLSCETCLNGNDALNKLKQQHFDVLLTDIQMPKMDGLTLIKKVRDSAEINHIPAIAISGRTDVNPEEYKEAGFTKSLIKPYNPSDLLLTLAKIFEVEVNASNYGVPDKKGRVDYNLDEIYQFSGGDSKALQTILKAFLSSSESNLKSLELAHQKSEKDEMASIAHKMLPMFRQMKATKIAKTLSAIEERENFSKASIQELKQDVKILMNDLELEVTA